jgi:serine/threonine-protein phosphatase PGAM5
VSIATRTLILVRHGQFHSDETHRRRGRLTTMGIQQARRTAGRIAQYPVDVIHSSTMPRAVETARLIHARMRRVPLRWSHLLREGIPSPAPGMPREQRAGMPRARRRIERAFAKYFRSTRGRDRCEVIVAHGNIIRYLLRRAIGDAPGRWWRYKPLHCGLSIVLIPSEGPTRIWCINDIGHLPRRMQTVT